MLEKVNAYCDDILSGKIPSGIHTKGAVERFRSDYARTKDGSNSWVFKEKSVKKVVSFIAKLKHFTGKHNKKSFKLEPWQLFIVANLYGFYNLNGTRRFNMAYIEMARKQGKTALIAALSLYHMMGDDEAAAEVLIAANSKDQAKIGFNLVAGFARYWHNDDHSESSKFQVLRKYRDEIKHDETLSLIKTLAADSSVLDGYNCSFGVVDEFHSSPDSTVRDVLESSQGIRDNPLLITITTAGFDKSLPCYELRTTCTEVIAGIKKDDSMFSIIYSLDDEDDWQDPKMWIKSNPNLGVTLREEWLSTKVQKAIDNPSDEVAIKTKNLNMWCDSAKTWIPERYAISSTQNLKIEDFAGEKCYIGVDLAATSDLTAVSYMFERDDKFYFFNDFYIPTDTLGNKDVHVEKDLYRKWAATGYLKTTPGNATDYEYITSDMLAIRESVPIKTVYYDNSNATAWAISATEHGFKLAPYSQAIANFNKVTREFERAMLGGNIILDDNPIIRYCLRNVELRRDSNGNVKPRKDLERKKVDGVISMLQALAAYFDVKANYKGINVY